jgi:quercetin dioxygenase-like cupin family protein
MATFSASGEGERLWFLGTLATIRLPAEASGGRFALIEHLLPHLASPPLHTHPEDETYFVLEGGLTLLAGEARFELGPGDACSAPAGVPHTFRVDTEIARVLLLSTPAGLERMMRDASVPAEAPTLPPPGTPRPAPDELAAIFERHETVILGPPLAAGA